MPKKKNDVRSCQKMKSVKSVVNRQCHTAFQKLNNLRFGFPKTDSAKKKIEMVLKINVLGLPDTRTLLCLSFRGNIHIQSKIYPLKFPTMSTILQI